MYFSIYLFIYLGLEVDINICLMLFPSLAGQPALLLFFFFCGLTLFSICAPLLPSLQLSKLKRLLALQRESCRPSCPLIKQIVSTHTHTRAHALAYTEMLTQTSPSASLSIWPLLSEKVKYVLRRPHICRGIRELQLSRRELSRPIRQLTRLCKGQRNFILHTRSHKHPRTHLRSWRGAWKDLALIRFTPELTNLNLILNFNPSPRKFLPNPLRRRVPGRGLRMLKGACR